MMSKTRQEIMDFYYDGVLEVSTPLVAFKVSGDSFYCDFEENDEIVDFEELTVIVERQWLFNNMRGYGIDDPLTYLQEEYTSDDSKQWFDEGVVNHKVVAISF